MNISNLAFQSLNINVQLVFL